MVSVDVTLLVALVLAVVEALELTEVDTLVVAELDCELVAVLVRVDVPVLETDDVPVLETVVISQLNNFPSEYNSSALLTKVAMAPQFESTTKYPSPVHVAVPELEPQPFISLYNLLNAAAEASHLDEPSSNTSLAPIAEHFSVPVLLSQELIRFVSVGICFAQSFVVPKYVF